MANSKGKGYCDNAVREKKVKEKCIPSLHNGGKQMYDSNRVPNDARTAILQILSRDEQFKQ